jgi:hypothetical protein
MSPLPVPLSRLLAASLLLFVSAAPLTAQYFGRNNPQFRTFDFQVLQTDHFDIYYYPEAEEGVRDAARMAERWYTRLSQILGHELSARQPIILYGAHADFQQTNILGSPVGEGTGGVTESFKQRIIMPLAHTYAQTDHVLGHELVHAFQYDISGLGRSAGSIDAGARALAQAPLWWIEGMAEYLTLGPVDSHTAMWLRDAAVTGRLPTLQQLGTDPRIFPYRYGHAIWSYITGRWGDQVVGEILRAVGDGQSYAAAMGEVLGVEMDELSADWQVAVRRTYLPLLATYNEAREIATPLITAQTRGGRVNLAPAVSQDGRLLAFLSERGFLDVELWLADATTGEVIRRLVRGAAFDAHFGSLNFIASAGSFSPDARQLAFSALRRGTNVLAIVNVERGGVIREIAIPGVPEITNPSWSPDGGSIAFAGTQGGITNIYLHDLATGETRQLTSGRNADLMPSFSPDGTRIAFTTDRGPGTDLETLAVGGYRIAVVDIATGEIELLPGMQGARNFNPVWTAAGDAIHFISDRDGIANVFRIELAPGTVAPTTTVFRGVSGITALSPALAIGGADDMLVFSVFEAGNYNLYRFGRDAPAPPAIAALPAPPPPDEEVAQLVAAPLPDAGLDAPVAAVLPPAPRPAAAQFRQVAGYLDDVVGGLPAADVAADWPTAPYRPRLSLDFIAQPQVGVAVGGGTGQGGLQGGIGALFSDMLAWHTVFGVIQAQGAWDEIGFSATYLYRRLPTDFGVGLQRIPFVSARRQQGFDPQENVFRDQIQRFRTFDWQLQGLAQHPFSRVQRVEFAAGLRRLSRDIVVQEVVFDPVRDPAGNIIDFQNPRVQEQREGLDAINLAQASAALVFDNALLGWTSPFAGQRYRFEVSPTAGALNFVTGLADYRRYFWLQPFTFAARGLHFGRYGLSVEDEQRIGPLFLGQPQLLRGYDYNALASRCLAGMQNAPGNAAECRIIDQLFGQQLAVANFELRFPLVRALVLGTGFGVPPIEGFLFTDAGVAWGRGTSPVLATGVQADPGDRGILASGGIGGRLNLFGYAILEAAYVRPFADNLGWRWHFALQPGF